MEEFEPFNAEVSEDALIDEAPKEVDELPQQVQSTKVIYMPRKDFDARVNQHEYSFKKGVPAEVTRDLANMLLEEEDRGYVKE